jgi:hypothetical protein
LGRRSRAPEARRSENSECAHASTAKAADEAGEIADPCRQYRLDALRTRRATTGDVPPVPTATTTSPRSTMAGKMKVECARSSITLTGRPTAFARTDIATPCCRRRRRGLRNDAAEIGRERIALANPIARHHPRRARPGRDCRRSQTSEPAHRRYQQAEFRAHEVARSDEQHHAALQIEEQGQKSHAILASQFPG